MPQKKQRERLRLRKLSDARREFLKSQLAKTEKALAGTREHLGCCKKHLEEAERISLDSTKLPLGSDKAVVVVDEGTHIAMSECLTQIIHSQESAIQLLKGILAGKVGDSYGICSYCERRISKRRLEVMAWAEQCVPCLEAAGTAE